METTELTLEKLTSPLASRQTRPTAVRGRESSKGSILASLPKDKGAQRILGFDSKREQRTLFVLLARNDVFDIWDQPPPIIYLGDDGASRRYTPDILVTLKSGVRYAVEVKSTSIASRPSFKRKIKAVRKAMRKDYADDLLVMTEANVGRDEALNAERMLRFRRNENSDVRRRLDDALSNSQIPATVGELVNLIGCGGAGFQSIVVALYDGRLSADVSSEITYKTAISCGENKQ